MGLDYYGILGINRRAELPEIQRAFRNLALKHHPRRYKGPWSENLFALIAEAYDVLTTPKYKSLYDQYGEEAIKVGIPMPPRPMEETGPTEKYVFHGDPFKVFREFFGVDNPFAEVKLPNIDPEYKYCPIPVEQKLRGDDLNIIFYMSLEEAFRGFHKRIIVRKRVFDDLGRKTVLKDVVHEFDVPRGCVDGRKFIFEGAGNQERSVNPGDLIFEARLQKNKTFILEGKNFVIKRTIPLAYALAGCVIDVTTMDGVILHIPITDVVKPGKRLVIPGEGMTTENSSKRGDLIVEFDVEFPDRLGRKQRALIRAAFFNEEQAKFGKTIPSPSSIGKSE